MKLIKLDKFKEYSIFIWLILISFLGIITYSIYLSNKLEQSKKISSSLQNIYLKKTISEITNNLEPRFTYIKYISKAGDNFQGIIDNLNVSKKEKEKILSRIKNEKNLKILRVNQKFLFKLDNLSSEKVIEFKIETDRKNEIVFAKSVENSNFVSKIIKKNFQKNLVYKETLITTSLYNNAIQLGISPNIIIEFARLYGFQIDFQRDVWKNDSFQIIYEEFTDENKKVSIREK